MNEREEQRPGAEQSSGGALAGLKVIDLTRVLGGPYCTQVLADHGAQVVKIEPPQGDEVRDWGPPFHEGDASYFIGVNRNKRALALDLSREEGREVLMTLLDGADVLIENYKPGSMEKWGMGFEEVLSKRFPKLVHCRISGFGADGPLGSMPGYDAIVQAMSGMFSVNGDAASGPTRIGIPIVDIGTGLYAAIGILMALYERARSGRGQFVDMTLYDCGLSLMHPHFANYNLSGKNPVLTGNAHPNISPYDKFATATCDIFVAIGNNRAFRRFCTLLGEPSIAEDPRFKDNGGRVTDRAALTEALSGPLSKVDGADFATKLLGEGIPCGPVVDTAAALAHPHTAHRGMRVESDWYRGTGTPVKLSRTPAVAPRPPPRFSQHARAVLAEHGFDETAIERLVEAGVLVEARKTG
jgi:crotonobetainyl-CoA:carnitine CoA-transferase CaiB-like acyl-CoA transferase